MQTEFTTLRSRPSHLRGMMLGAIIGLPFSWFAAWQYVQAAFVRPDDARVELWFIVPVGIAVSALLGHVMSVVYHKVKDKSAAQEALFEKEVQLQFQLERGSPLHASYESLGQWSKSVQASLGFYGWTKRLPKAIRQLVDEDPALLTLLTDKYLIHVLMIGKDCRAVCEYVVRGKYRDCGKLLSSIVLPKAESIRAIAVSAIRKIVFRPRTRCLKISLAGEKKDGLVELSIFTRKGETEVNHLFSKLRQCLRCERPVVENTASGKQLRRQVLSVLAAVICFSAAAWCAFAVPHTAAFYFAVFVLVVVGIVFIAIAENVWFNAREQVVFDHRSLAAPNHKKAPSRTVLDM